MVRVRRAAVCCPRPHRRARERHARRLVGSPSHGRRVDPPPLAAVAWPTSGSLLLAEVVTGGGSASDEYVEITNAAAATVDLGGLELVYVTSTGSTVTRKATWPTPDRSRPVSTSSSPTPPGPLRPSATRRTPAASRRPVVPWRSGRSAATPIDAVGWGDAANAFVEGTVAPAAAGRIEPRAPAGRRRPGTSSTRTTTALTGWSSDRRCRRTCLAAGSRRRPDAELQPGLVSDPRSDPAPVAGANAQSDADPESDRLGDSDGNASSDARRPPRPRPCRPRRPRPHGHPDADPRPDAHAIPDTVSASDPANRDRGRSPAAGRERRDRRGRRHRRARLARGRAVRVRPGRERRDRDLSSMRPRRSWSRPGPGSGSAAPSTIAMPSGPCGSTRDAVVDLGPDSLPDPVSVSTGSRR